MRGARKKFDPFVPFLQEKREDDERDIYRAKERRRSTQPSS